MLGGCGLAQTGQPSWRSARAPAQAEQPRTEQSRPPPQQRPDARAAGVQRGGDATETRGRKRKLPWRARVHGMTARRGEPGARQSGTESRGAGTEPTGSFKTYVPTLQAGLRPIAWSPGRRRGKVACADNESTWWSGRRRGRGAERMAAWIGCTRARDRHQSVRLQGMARCRRADRPALCRLEVQVEAPRRGRLGTGPTAGFAPGLQGRDATSSSWAAATAARYCPFDFWCFCCAHRRPTLRGMEKEDEERAAGAACWVAAAGSRRGVRSLRNYGLATSTS